MKLVCLGLNHETAPVEVRECFALSESEISEEGKLLIEDPAVAEGVVLSTCNRTEYYAVIEDGGVQHLENWVCSQRNYEGTREGVFYYYESRKAAEHLCRVASGMNSMVLGETEIFGQVKKAYQAALTGGTTSGILNKLFQRAFGVGKRVRTQTGIQEGATSVAGAAVELAEQVFGKLKGSSVMVVGAGEMSRQTAQALQSRGASSVIVTNRSFPAAEKLAAEIGGGAVGFDDWQNSLEKIDVLISSTSAPHFVVKPRDIEAVRRKRKFRPLIMVDIAVPRDIDPEVGEIEEVYLYDIDTLQGMASRARTRRLEQLKICEGIIDEELTKAALLGLE
ncbi:glutamyl-tRNA reductase [Akkermansiaceae bacterium]|jgi:glutamyl-tRNA reductase|nr:glutamyl-tRNA reductase [Akkermansiaceae bacterium]|tara:strand:+ start:3713 stop:4720 length:1008 start_codon:yes stop_codon:yes gene_type:complete